MDLHIRISPDRLQAVLDLPQGKFIDVAVLKLLLQKGGIVYGLRAEGLHEAIHAADHDRSIILAEGKAVTPIFEGGFDPSVALKELPPSIEAGRVIGHFIPAAPALPGMGVDGHPIPVPESNLTVPEAYHLIGRGLDVRADGVVVATRQGHFTRDADGRFRVAIPGLEERERSDLFIQIDQKNMQVWVDLNPGEYCNRAHMDAALAKLGVVHGIDEHELNEVNRPDVEHRILKIARGTDPIDGVNAEIVMLLDDSRHAQEDVTGHMDFHEMGKLLELKAGSPIAQVQHATPGTPGMNVKGKEVKQKNGLDIDISQLVGEGTRLNPSNKNLLEADIPGVFRRHRSGKFMVQPLLIVEGDVDFKNGNIDTELSVMIKGDIKKGFTVKSGGDIVVMGVIEDARISAKGNITVKGGLLPGSHRVKAHGDVDVRYINGRPVKGHNIRVKAGVTSSRLLATGDIEAKEIVSGFARCAGNITVEVLGSESGQKTSVEVGMNPLEEALFEGARNELKHLELMLPSLKEHCRVVAHKRDAVSEGTQEYQDISQELRDSVKAFSEACTHHAECQKLIQRHTERAAELLKAGLGCRVVVKKEAHIGVELRIAGEAHLELWEPLHAASFYYKDGQVSW